MMTGDNKGWYILRAVSGKEAKVKEILDAQAKNTDLGNYLFQVVIPTEKVYIVRNGKKVLKDRILMTGYVFVECNLTGEVEYLLKNTTNVKDFLRGREKGAKPEKLPESEVLKMLGKADGLNENPADELFDYVVGEPVKVTFGPFAGCKGTVREVNMDKRKLKVEVKIFGRPAEVELDNSQVERELS